jgi:hypothetical protein
MLRVVPGWWLSSMIKEEYPMERVQIQTITFLSQPVKVTDESGQIGMLITVDSSRANPFYLQALNGSYHWYCRSVTVVKNEGEVHV